MHLSDLPQPVVLRICHCLTDPQSVVNLLQTCSGLAKLIRDPELVSDWLTTHKRPIALRHACATGNTPATQRLLRTCDSPLRLTPHNTPGRPKPPPPLPDNPPAPAPAPIPSPFIAQAPGTDADDPRTGPSTRAHSDATTSRHPLTGIDPFVQHPPPPLFIDRETAVEALCAAARAGHADLVSELLRWGVPADGGRDSAGGDRDVRPDRVERVDDAPLVAAAGAGQVATAVTLMVGEQVDGGAVAVTGLTDSSSPPATPGAVARKPYAARRLRFHDQGGVLNACDPSGAQARRALVVAARGCHLSMVRLLLTWGVAAWHAGVGEEAVVAACSTGHIPVVKELASVGFTACLGGEALAAAAGHGQLDMLRWLWCVWQYPPVIHTHADSSAPADIPTLYQSTPVQQSSAVQQQPPGAGEALVAAARGGHAAVVQQMIEWGASKEHAANALVVSAEQGHELCVKHLIQGGADINFGDGDALRFACSRGYARVVEMLVSAGVVFPPDSASLLRDAAGAGQLELVRVLLRSGVDCHASDESALRHAASAGRVEVVAELLCSPWCADVHALDDEALLWAADNGHEDVVRLLLSHGARASELPLLAAAAHGHSSVVAMLLTAGAMFDS